MPRADFLFSLVLIALGLAAAVEAWRMPRFGELGINPMTAPGLTPGLLGLVIAVMGLALMRNAIAAGALRRQPAAAADEAEAAQADRRSRLRRLALTVALTIGYAGFLVSNLPFWLATGIFVFLFVTLFEWPERHGLRQRLAGLGIALVLAVATAAGVTYLFEEIFLVRLP